ncbi:putative UDP-N-acetylglucosamine--peptide N-acetylglucosaminyltransferase [Paratrimastix pyriformis]|uniref:protein O-GlcNAc transferase n=1 Tax=Paratrimastix pyriformis TaxID=342808 RepID=A0ABQ8UQ94_9EUKA|nr:putative UDP-N-acetylglucosamine--peptide N-acetylglucosaminyltransferase [Paratrimastix pyriformis]
MAEQLCKLADIAARNGRVANAIELYKQALALNDPASKVPDIMNVIANLFKQDNHFDEAESWYRRAIVSSPSFAPAWGNLAALLFTKGRLNEAVSASKRALTLNPTFVDAYSNLGNIYKQLGKMDDAIANYDRAIKLRPNFAIAYGNKATVYHDMGNYDAALPLYRKALELDPTVLDVYNNMGNALKALGRLDEAIQCYKGGIKMQPNNPHVLNNLGNALKEKGLFKEARRAYQQALESSPNFTPVLNNLASLLKDLGHLPEATSMYQRALAVDPNFVDALSNLGNAYKDAGRFEDALAMYQRAIALKPDFADAHSNMASVYKDTNRHQEAIAGYRRALELRPDFPDAFANYAHCLQTVCEWHDREAVFARLAQLIDAQLKAGRPTAVQPFHALVYPIPSALVLDIARHTAAKAQLAVSHIDLAARPMRPAPRTRVPRPPAPDRLHFPALPHPAAPAPASGGAPQPRLHVGYLSSDFGDHPLSHLMQSVFGMHNRSLFKVTCYALTPSDGSAWRRKIEEEAESFVDISRMTHEEAARRINADRVQLLINLNGYTKGCRNEICALRPAPIQARRPRPSLPCPPTPLPAAACDLRSDLTYMGYPATMGAEFIDYYITDEYVTPASLAWTFTERLIRMPDSYFVNDHLQAYRDAFDPANRPDLPKRADFGLPEDKLVLCNFNQLYKNDPAGLDRWCNILRRVPHAVLWLLRFPPEGEANIRAEVRARGIADDRVIFSNLTKKDIHIKRSYLADLFLDTKPYNAHTTGTDALWAGLPLVTLPGYKMVSRVASGLVTALGCPEMVVTTPAEYEDLAVAWCTNQGPHPTHLPTEDDEHPDAAPVTFENRMQLTLQQVRNHLWHQRTQAPLFNTQYWVQCLEVGLWKAWERYCDELPCDHIDVRAECGMEPISFPVFVPPEDS